MTSFFILFREAKLACQLQSRCRATKNSIYGKQSIIKDVFDRVDFREDEKKNEEEKPVEGCLVRRGRGKRDGGVWEFSPKVLQKAVFSPKWGEN